MNSSGDEGVIVFTLGTYFASVTKFQPKFVDMFAEAFRRLPQKVIWQLKELPKKELPPNVKALPWVPQNDLLGEFNNIFFNLLTQSCPFFLLNNPYFFSNLDLCLCSL